MAPLHRIVVGVDGSDGAAGALRWAADEAGLHDAELTAVMAWGYLDQHHSMIGEPFDPGYAIEDARSALRSYVAGAVGEEAAGAVHAEVVCDLAVRALLDRSRDADLLVVGARGVGGFRELLLGSVSQRCLHHTTVPIAVVRPGAEPVAPQRRVVVGVDGSTTAQRALRWAIAEACARGAKLEVVAAWQFPYSGTLALPSVYDPDSWSQETFAIVERAIAAEDTFDLDVQPVALHGSPAAGLLEHAAAADLLVVGSRGLGAFRRAAMGSVATQVTHHATCPVVVIPADPTDH